MVLDQLGMLGAPVVAAGVALAAGRKNFDLLGGGGTLRDLLLERHPIFWVEAASHLTVILGIAAMPLDLGSSVILTIAALAVSGEDYCV